MANRVPVKAIDRVEYWTLAQEKLRLAHNAVGTRFRNGEITAAEWHRYWYEEFYPRSATICLALNEAREGMAVVDEIGEPRYTYDQEKFRKSNKYKIDVDAIEKSGRQLGVDDPIEDWTTYTEVDPNSHISKTSSVITFTDLTRGETAYVYSDKGAAHFDGDFEHLVDTKQTAHSDSGIFVCWALANDLNDYYHLIANNNSAIIVRLSNATTVMTIYEIKGGGVTGSGNYTFAEGTRDYLKIKRDEAVGTYGTVYCYIYSDAARTSLLATLSVTLTEKQDFRYVYGVNTYNDGNAYTVNGDVSNLDLQEVISKAIASGITVSATVGRGIARSVSAGVALSATAQRVIAKGLSAGVVLSATVSRFLLYTKTILAGIALSADVGRTVGKGISATLISSASVGRTIARAISASFALTGSVPSRPFTKAISTGVALSAAVGRTVKKTIATTLVASVTVGRNLTRSIAAGVALSVGVGRSMSRSISTGFVLSATATRKVGKALAAGVVLSSTMNRTIRKPIAATLVTSVTVGRFLWRSVSTGITLSASVGRTIKKNLATATIVLTSSLVRKVHELLEGGIELSATVGRLIKKHIQAGVTLIGQTSKNVYDMAWEMNKPIRKILGKVAITYSDPFFSAGLTAEASETGDYTYPAQTADNVTTEAYKWFSLHRNALDGTFHPLPSNQEYSVGWWSATLCDAVTAIFAAPPVLTINHSARTVESLLVVGDDKLDEYPVDFWVRLYSEGDVLEHTSHVTGNAAVTWTEDLSPSETDIVKHELTIDKWSRVGSVAKIAQFFTMLEETYESEDGDLFSIRVLEEREFSEATIPQGNISANEIYVRLNNIDDIFTAGNINSRLYGLLLNNRAIRAWLGCDLRSGERIWFPLGTFYSRNWSTPEGEPWAEVTGLDMLDRLKQTEFSVSEVYTNVTLHDLAVTVMTDAGLTDADWDIDPVLDTAPYTVANAWFDRMSHRAALKKIAAAALGQVYCDRDGKIVIAVYVPPARMPASDFHFTESNFFEVDHPLEWTEMVNYVQAQAAPRVASAEEDICLDTEEFTVPGSGTVTKTHFFDFSPCVDVVDPLVFTQSDVHISLDSMTIYAWGVSATYSNSDPGDETVTSVTIRGKRLEVQGGRVTVAEDTDSISANGKQTLASPITSEFWQTEAQAQAVADSLLASYKDPRRDVVMRARGNIALLLGDRVVAPDFRDEVSAEYGLMRQDINYDGGMEVALVAQRIPGGLVTHYKHISAGLDLQSTISKTKKTHWKHVSAGIDLQGTVVRKALKALSGGITVAGTITKFASSQRKELSAGVALGVTVGRVWPIDVGAPATDRGTAGGLNQTFIQVDNPANNPGVLTTVKLWANLVDQSEGWKVGTFYGSGISYTSRDSATLPTVSAGYNEFSGLSIDVAEGDFIGIYCPASAKVDLGTPATYYYFAAGDTFGAGLKTYTLNTDYGISLNGIGQGNN